LCAENPYEQLRYEGGEAENNCAEDYETQKASRQPFKHKAPLENVAWRFCNDDFTDKGRKWEQALP
jgi:hypothetical protein